MPKRTDRQRRRHEALKTKGEFHPRVTASLNSQGKLIVHSNMAESAEGWKVAAQLAFSAFQAAVAKVQEYLPGDSPEASLLVPTSEIWTPDSEMRGDPQTLYVPGAN